MKKKIIIAAVVLVVVLGLALTAHLTNFVGIVQRMHGV